MEKESWSLAGLIVFLVFLIVWQPRIGWSVQELLSGPRRADSELDTLKKENARLKSEAELLESVRAQLPEEKAVRVPALVYSRYPYNFRNELLVNAGAAEGISPEDAVLFGEFLLGAAKEVFEDSSVVRTVFDYRWQSAVRVGAQGFDALLVGGNQPRITLIDRQVKVKAGDSIVSASPGFPVGTPVGEVRAVTLSADQLFQEATITFPYDMRDVRAVSVRTKNAAAPQQ
ncbi:MAG: rod shape-determining protein MreC [Candidatus Liptonbacteria bacterium]|nr:rod shape-determining protein MreC [Candidatus Liptonbacteria bacterium]